MGARVHAAVEMIAKCLAALGLVCLIGFAAMTLVGGVGRSLLGVPIDLVNDAGSLIVAAAVASCFPIALWHKSNIRINLVTALLPGADRALGLFADVMVLVVTVAVARQMFIYARNSASAGDATAMLDIPTAPVWYYVAFVLAVAAAVQAVIVAGGVIRAFAGVVSPPTPPVH
jgi:TRAP-type C4-dicarboxylate transport system permease small subunit